MSIDRIRVYSRSFKSKMSNKDSALEGLVENTWLTKEVMSGKIRCLACFPWFFKRLAVAWMCTMFLLLVTLALYIWSQNSRCLRGMSLDASKRRSFPLSSAPVSLSQL